MKTNARFKVLARLDQASRLMEGTVTINRAAGTFTVRPLGRRRVYELPLATVADLVVQRIIKAEVFGRRIEKAKKAKEKRDARYARAAFKRKLKLVP